MASFVNQQDLEQRITARKVIEAFDEDGDGNVDSVSDQQGIQQAIFDANDTVESILLGKGFSRDQLNALSQDAQIRRAATQLAAQLAGERRTEWINDRGEGLYHAMGERGRKNLERLATAEYRSRLEPTTAGENSTIDARISVGEPRFVVARDPNDSRGRGPGGF